MKEGRYEIKMRTETIRESCRLNETQYCGWLAINTGTVAVKVFGFNLQPGEGLSSQSIIQTSGGDLWKEPINIEIPSGGEVRMSRAIGTPIR